MTAVLDHPLVSDETRLDSDQLMLMLNGEDRMRQHALGRVVYNVVGYLRISKDRGKEAEREGAGLGVRRQHHDVGERCPGVEFWYVDNDVSAYSGKERPHYRQLLAHIISGQISPTATIWAWHTDRLHRQTAELEEFCSTIYDPAKHKRDISVETVKAGKLDLKTAAGRLNARLQGMIAQYHSEHMSEQIRGKLEQKARNGEPLTGRRTYGYKLGGLEIEQSEANAIRWGVAKILTGGTLNDVCREWDRRGLRTLRSNKFMHPSTVKDVLTRPRIAGLYEFRGEVVGEGNWPAIVSTEELEAVRHILCNPARRAKRGTTPQWLGSGLYVCGNCGSTLLVKGTTAKGRYKAYGCRSTRFYSDVPRAAGVHPTRLAANLDHAVGLLVVERVSQPNIVEALAARNDPQIDLSDLRAERDSLNHQINEYQGYVGEPGWTPQMIHGAVVKLGSRVADIEGRLAASISTSLVSTMAAAPSPAVYWEKARLDTQRAILSELVTVTVLPGAPKGKRGIDPDYLALDWAV